MTIPIKIIDWLSYLPSPEINRFYGFRIKSLFKFESLCYHSNRCIELQLTTQTERKQKEGTQINGREVLWDRDIWPTISGQISSIRNWITRYHEISWFVNILLLLCSNRTHNRQKVDWLITSLIDLCPSAQEDLSIIRNIFWISILYKTIV